MQRQLARACQRVSWDGGLGRRRHRRIGRPDIIEPDVRENTNGVTSIETNAIRDRVRGPDKRAPLLAIVGRPNVGKSTLFNRLVGSRRAIVGDEPGITRDRLYGEAEWRGHAFRVVDTGGIIPEEKDFIPA